MAQRDIGNLRTRLSWEDEGANKSLEGFRRDLRGLRSEMNLAKSHGKDYTRSLKGMREQSDILSRRFKTQEERVKELRKRYKELADAGKEDTVQAKNLASQINNATAEMNRTEEQLKRLNAEIRRQESPWTQLGEKMDTTGKKMQEFGRGMTSFGRDYSMRVTAPIVAGGVAMFKASMDYESAFAGVRKTVDATEEQFDALSAGIREMAKELPASAVEIAGVAESAGQLGIATEHILSFTRTMIDLGEATNLTSGQAATEFARFANIVGMSQDDFDKLGSTVVDLGNNLATTESEIVSMGMRLAGAGAQIGLTEAQIMAFAGALSSVGIEAEAGGSAFSKVMVNLQLAAERGGKELENFASVAGMSAQEFKQAYEQDAAGAIITFIEGLAKAEERGESAIGVLDEMGITEVRMRDALLRAAGASDVFTDSLNIGTNAWKENTALTEEAEERYKTTESQLKILWDRIKDVAITTGNVLAPALLDAIDAAEPLIQKIEDGTQAFSEMDKEQQQTILKMIALAAAIGPASIGIGQLSSGVGGLLKIGGSAAKMLGRAGGAGLIGRLGLMGGPAGVATIAAVGIGTLAYKLYDAHKESKELNDISTETTEKLLDQANTLEDLVDEYDKLKLQSGLTKDEFGRLLDIQQELNETQNPARIAELKDEFKKLAEKSGLTKDEINKLVKANNDIIEQSPQVEKSFSDKGNAIVDSTDAVRDYIDSLKDMAWVELEAERTKALENEAQLRKENKEINEEIKQVEEDIQELIEMREMPLSEVDARLAEIQDKMDTGLLTQEEYNELEREQGLLLQLQNDNLVEGLEALQEQRSELIKKKELNDEELAKLDQINAQMADTLLQEVDINFEKGEGLNKLDEKIAKLKDQRAEMVENTSEEIRKTDEYKEQLRNLDEAINKHEDIRDKIREETGYESESNKKKREGVVVLNEQDNKLLHIGSQHDINNKKIDDGTGKARTLNDVLGRRITKIVNTDLQPTADKINEALSKPVNKRVKVVQEVANRGFSSFGKIFGYATGTDYHPGGPFVAGEEGFELGRLGNRWEMLDFGMYNRPSSYEVFTHDESKKIIRALNNLPGYANGASRTGEADRVVNSLNTQTNTDNRVIGLLQDIANRVREGQIIVMNDREVAKTISPHISNIQEKERIQKNRARGIS